MPNSFTKIYFHIVFCTKNRLPFISKAVESGLYGYMNGIALDLGANTMALGGIHDHVHLLLSLPPRLALSDVLRGIKGGSSWWMNRNGNTFAWQPGYGAFTLHESLLPTTRNYILKQKTHHRSESFEDEQIRLFGERD